MAKKSTTTKLIEPTVPVKPSFTKKLEHITPEWIKESGILDMGSEDAVHMYKVSLNRKKKGSKEYDVKYNDLEHLYLHAHLLREYEIEMGGYEILKREYDEALKAEQDGEDDI